MLLGATVLFTLLATVSSQGVNLTFILSAKNLPEGKDDITKNDAQVKVYHGGSGSELEKFGSTEVIVDNDNPEWVEVFWFLWKKGTSQKWHFEVKDQDVLDKDDPLGGADVDVDSYVAGGENMTVSLGESATLTIQKTTPIKFKLSAKYLPKKDKLPSIVAAFSSDEGQSDPYVKCYFRRGVGGEDKKFATTSTIDNVVDADWEDTIEFGNYQKGTDQYWRFKVKDADSTSKDDDIGEAILNIDSFVDSKAPKTVKISSDGGTETGATLTITPA
jgi:Ca2+-dependent lipid-binding protein